MKTIILVLVSLSVLVLAAPAFAEQLYKCVCFGSNVYDTAKVELKKKCGNGGTGGDLYDAHKDLTKERLELSYCMDKCGSLFNGGSSAENRDTGWFCVKW